MPEPRNLTPAIPASDDTSPRPWRLIGNGGRCTFCGCSNVEATVGCPDENGPLVFNVGVCSNCLVDCVMRRFSEVKHQRLARLGQDMAAAAGEIRDARRRAREERYEREFARYRARIEPRVDPEAEAEAAQRLAAEEQAIVRRHDMPPGWSADEFNRRFEQAWRERKTRD